MHKAAKMDLDAISAGNNSRQYTTKHYTNE